MLASFSQFIRDTGSNLTPAIPQRFSSAASGAAAAPQQTQAQAETDIASTTSTTDREHEPDARAPVPEGEVVRERRRREKKSTIYETFIVVRPPPAMSNHPLNLQLQLVPPTAKDSARQPPSLSRSATSASADPNEPPSTRPRSPSMRSNRSNTSLYSSASYSTTSIASSASSTTRRIIPLYNLSAHNVITNTITDAGTDAKIAKFGKRGIEVIGLGILECYEVIGVAIDPQALALHKAVSNGSLSRMSQEMPVLSESTMSAQSSTKASSSITPSSSTSHFTNDSATSTTGPTAAALATLTPSTPTPNSAKKLFGKMFKRKDAASPIVPASPTTPTPANSTPTPVPSSPSFFRSSKRASGLSASSTTCDMQSSKAGPSSLGQDLPASVGSIQPPVLGTNATLLYRTKSKSTIIAPSVIANLVGSGPGHGLALHATRSRGSAQTDDFAPRSREPSGGQLLGHGEQHPEILLEGVASSGSTSPVMSYKRTSHSYEWVMRRWIKGGDNGLFGIKESLLSAKSAVFSGLDIPEGSSIGEGMVEVRFEWVKGKGFRERERMKEEKERAAARMENLEEAESTAGEGGRSVPTRRSRPKSMVGGGEYEPGSEGAGRPSSMFVPGSGPATPDKQRKSLTGSVNASPATLFGSTTDGTNRTPSPDIIRPSMDSVRRSSDGSGELGQHATPSSSIGGHTGASVYKGEKKTRRQQSILAREKRPDAGALMFGGGGGGDASDGEESDPEDSETPWTCTLYVGPAQKPAVVGGGGGGGERGRNARGAAGALGSSSDAYGGHARYATSPSAQIPSWAAAGQVVDGHRKVASVPVDEPAPGLRIKLATMTPAPHHPKVVAYVKMPFPLPDVNVDRMAIATNDADRGGDLILTMEEIKDVVCVTGLWLVVREGFGGLERRRRGDGWKIRG